jgi:hypothetical protein
MSARRAVVGRSALLLLFFGLAACTPDFEQIWLVKDLRILGLQADPPEVLVPIDAQYPPATFPTVHVSGLVVDPPEAASVTVRWELWACSQDSLRASGMNAGGTLSDSVRCDTASRSQQVANGTSALSAISADFTLDRDLYSAALAADVYKIGPIALGGVPVVLDLQVTSDTVGFDRAIKRVVYGNPLPLLKTANVNPHLDKVLVDDVDQSSLQVKVGQTVKLLPVPMADAAEGYWVATFKGLCSKDSDCEDGQAGTQCVSGICSRHLTEYLSYAFFTTAGTLSDATTGGKPSPFINNKKIADPSSSWAAPSTPGKAQLWVVIRDDRGGLSWKTLQAEVTE